MSDYAKSQGAQCWICPQCYDDKHHEPGDMRCLQQQKKEAMAIASLNQIENRHLRQQLEQAEARVAELEDAASWCEAENGDMQSLMALVGVVERGNSQSWLLRKQAEAVEKAAKRCTPKGLPLSSILGYAQRLRQQADEAERAGGEK